MENDKLAPPSSLSRTAARLAAGADPTDGSLSTAHNLTSVDPQFTHESKLPPVALERPRPRLASGPTLAALAGIGSAVAIATAFAFSPPATKPVEAQMEQSAASQVVRLPDVIQDQPTTPPPPPAAAGGREGTHAAPGEAAQQRAALKLARQEALSEELEKALTAPLYANIDDPFTTERKGISNGSSRETTPIDPSTFLAAASGAPSATNGSGGGLGVNDPTLQNRKNDFLAQTDPSDGYLKNPLVHPRSPYELKAGTIIPTVLVTGINSDLPGNIIGQVSQNVYDTVSGNYLLIPQGSKLIAKYDSMLSYGQERVLVCWQRLIRPDGTSLSLDCMPGVDLSGYAGFSDQVDHHWWRVISGIALGSVLAAGIQAPHGNVTGYVPTLGQSMAANAAGAVNQAGQQITSKALNIQPTVKVRPGFTVSVLVTKDLVLEPYSPSQR
jgi:type IV secretion system protein VirB10